MPKIPSHLTIFIEPAKDMFIAYCPELHVSAGGFTRNSAIEELYAAAKVVSQFIVSQKGKDPRQFYGELVLKHKDDLGILFREEERK